MRVLIVEDSRAILLSLSRLLRKWGHEVEQAANGVEALALLETLPVSLVISDWMMPEMDGLELCRQVRAADLDRYTYFILVTARSERADLVEGMEAGADDFIAKPFHPGELEVRVRAAQRVLELQDELAERNERLSSAYETIRRDLESAAQLQRELLPVDDAGLPDTHFRWMFLPSTFVAGDIFDFFALSDWHVGFYLLDVSGHGISSALLSVSVSRLLRPGNQQSALGLEAGALRAPADVVALLNNLFLSRGDSGQYFTMVYGVLDRRDGRVRFCQAGHPPPLLIRGDGETRFVGDGGFPVAMMPDMAYDEVEVTLGRGDSLVLYSDGITECTNDDGEAFGATRLATAVVQSDATGDLGLLGQRLQAWNGASAFADDVSLLAMQWTGGASA